MTTPYDFAALALFAGAVLVLWRLLRRDQPLAAIELAECLAVATGCALANHLGNAGRHGLAAVTLFGLAGVLAHLLVRSGKAAA